MGIENAGMGEMDEMGMDEMGTDLDHGPCEYPGCPAAGGRDAVLPERPGAAASAVRIALRRPHGAVPGGNARRHRPGFTR